MTPLISIVIPTRCRPETLKSALQSALDQDFDNYEIIVSDNLSGDSTFEIVNSFGSDKIKYVNTGKRLSMCDNWEFALSHVTGRYAIFIGDDDAIIPGSLKAFAAHIVATNYADCYMWPCITYWWPIDDKAPWVTNIPLEVVKGNLSSKTQAVTVEKDIKQLAYRTIKHGFWRYSDLPMSYHNAISIEIYKNITKAAGRVFHSNAPDFITFLELPVYAKTVVRLIEPVSIFGVSAKSNGGSSTAQNGDKVVEQFIKEYGEYKFHPLLPSCLHINHRMYMDPFLVPLAIFSDFYKNVKLNYSAMWSFMRRQKFINRKFVYDNLSEIKRTGSFSVIKFELYNALHDLFALRRRLLNRKFVDERRSTDLLNIYSFVKVLRDEFDDSKAKVKI